jgi:hypothetical protein
MKPTIKVTEWQIDLDVLKAVVHLNDSQSLYVAF